MASHWRNPARTFREARSVAFMERLHATMGNRVWSAQELAKAMHTERQNLMTYMHHLMSTEPRAAHIAGYRKPEHGGRCAYLYQLGNKPDARPPRSPA